MFATSLLTISTSTLKICIFFILNFSFNTDEHRAVLFDTRNALCHVLWPNCCALHCYVQNKWNNATPRKKEKKIRRKNRSRSVNRDWDKREIISNVPTRDRIKGKQLTMDSVWIQSTCFVNRKYSSHTRLKQRTLNNPTFLVNRTTIILFIGSLAILDYSSFWIHVHKHAQAIEFCLSLVAYVEQSIINIIYGRKRFDFAYPIIVLTSKFFLRLKIEYFFY